MDEFFISNLSSMNLNLSPSIEEGFWILPHQGIFLQEVQTPLPYALGGRSVYWGGWCNIPTTENLEGLDKEFIDNFYKYLKEASKVLNLVTKDKPKWLNNKYSHNAQFTLKNGHPLCLIRNILNNPNIKILAKTKTIKLVPGYENNIRGIHTTQGYLDLRKTPIILACGSFENCTILLRTNVTYNNDICQLGRNLIDHNNSIFKIRFPKKDNQDECGSQPY